MNMQFKSVHSFHKDRCIAFIIVCVFFLLLIAFVPSQVFATESEGWVEVRVSVPEGFNDTIIATFVQDETFEEYACRVMAINDYVEIFKLPAGNYTFDGAFLESSDFRYTTSLTNGEETFEVSAKKDAAAALITLKTTYHEEFEPVIEETPSAESIPEEETALDTVPVTEPSEPEPSKEEEPVTEPSEAVPEPSEDDVSTEPAEPSKKGNLVRILVSTGIFAVIVFLFAFIFRKIQKF